MIHFRPLHLFRAACKMEPIQSEFCGEKRRYTAEWSAIGQGEHTTVHARQLQAQVGTQIPTEIFLIVVQASCSPMRLALGKLHITLVGSQSRTGQRLAVSFSYSAATEPNTEVKRESHFSIMTFTLERRRRQKSATEFRTWSANDGN